MSVRPPSPQQFRDALNTLGVDADDDWDTVKRTYKKLIVEHHPDRGGSTEKAQQINEAFQLLKEWWDKREMILSGSSAPGPGGSGSRRPGGRQRQRPGGQRRQRGRGSWQREEEYVSWEEFFGEAAEESSEHHKNAWKAQVKRSQGCSCCNCPMLLILFLVTFSLVGPWGFALLARYWWVIVMLFFVWLLVDLLLRGGSEE